MPEKTTDATRPTGSAQPNETDRGLRWFVGLQIVKVLLLMGGVLLATHVAKIIQHAGEMAW